jgi:hypothetical protein
MKQVNKVIFIPGWLDKGKRHGYENSLNVWTDRVDIN